MSLLIRKIKLFFVKPKIEECIFSYVGNTIEKEYYFLMDVHFSVHDARTKKIIGIKGVTKMIDTKQEIEQIKRVLKEHPGVTIVVPCYNEQKTIAGTLKSLMSLDYPKDKLFLIVVDDGSTDNTWEVIKEFEKLHGYGVYDD